MFSPDARSVFVLEELKHNEVPDLRLYKIRSAWLVLKLHFNSFFIMGVVLSGRVSCDQEHSQDR